MLAETLRCRAENTKKRGVETAKCVDFSLFSARRTR